MRTRELGWWHPEWWVLTTVAAAWVVLIWAPLSRTAPSAMVIAMMLPLALPAGRAVAFSSLWNYRHLNLAAFVAGYLTVWLVAAAALMSAEMYVEGRIGPAITASGAIIATIGWEKSRFKRRALRRCERSPMLAASGIAALRDAAVFGLRVGVSCVTSCWCLMFVAWSFHDTRLLMFGITAYQWARPVEDAWGIRLTIAEAANSGRRWLAPSV